MERKKVLEPFYQQTKALNISCPSPNVSSIKNSTLEDISIKNKGSKQKDTTYQDCYSIPNGQLITSDFYNNHEEPIIQIPEPNQSNNSLIISLSQLSDPSISNFDSDCYIINSGVETALTVIKEIEKENKLKQTKKSRNNSEFFEQKENLNTTTPDITELLNILETNKNTQNLFIENSKEENNYASTDEYSYFEKNVNFNSTFIEIEKGIESNTEKNEKDIINFKQRSPKDFTEKTKDVKNVNLIIGEVKEKINKAETTNQKLKQERNKYQQNNMENKRIKEEMEMLIKMRNTERPSTSKNALLLNKEFLTLKKKSVQTTYLKNLTNIMSQKNHQNIDQKEQNFVKDVVFNEQNDSAFNEALMVLESLDKRNVESMDLKRKHSVYKEKEENKENFKKQKLATNKEKQIQDTINLIKIMDKEKTAINEEINISETDINTILQLLDETFRQEIDNETENCNKNANIEHIVEVEGKVNEGRAKQKETIKDTIDQIKPYNLATIDMENQRNGMSELYTDFIKPVPGGFENLTSINVPEDVKIILSLGYKFVIPSKITISDYTNYLYAINDYIEQSHTNPSISMGGHMIECYDVLINRLKQSMSSIEKNIKNKMEKTIQFIKEHKDICLVMSDKAKSIVLIYKNQYLEKMNAWIDKCIENGQYRKIETTEEARLINTGWYHEYILISNQLSDQYKNATEKPYPTSLHKSMLSKKRPNVPVPYLYGVLKTHKENNPCRPICNTRSHYCHPLQKIISHILTKVCNELLSEFNVRDINKVAEKIRSLTPFPDFHFYKLDIENMYPSMDRADIKNAVKKLIYHPIYKHKTSMCPNILEKMLDLCLGNNTIFLFNKTYYLQTSGLPQGACDSGLLATILLDKRLATHHEKIFLSNYVVLCQKYVDDFLFYGYKDSIEQLKRDITESTKLNYTIEKEEKPQYNEIINGQKLLGKISFLDIDIYRTTHRIYMRVYKKPMASDRSCHYLSSCAQIWKLNTLRAHINRILKRTSNIFLLEDLIKMEQVFQHNMYPQIYIDQTVRSLVRNNIDMLQNTLKNEPKNSQHPIHNLGDIIERITILYQYLKLKYIKEKIPVYRLPIKRMPYTKKTKHHYLKSNVYVCEEFKSVVETICKGLDLGHPQIDKLSTINNQQTKIYFIQCLGCTTIFLIGSQIPIMTLTYEILNNENSTINKHCKLTNHPKPEGKTPVQIQIQGDHIPASQQIILIKTIFETIGYECKTNQQIALLPQLVRKGIVRALAQNEGIKM
ncbi:uncharacterized protein LOC106088415 isoform X6 [Stomoxys calcitrans]|uniref:uncharacterized protein LOC106088415 isoform X5 n=1 Tax=Stomoxys calcitrans TaxID=35570 RepID=UPI0027E2C774|nr:uncharacterized protein LOC106088415 isoform X5 [Stomoxys calcitrans]XP_059226634.1 uncharacterized protein LOC106088415 isoform X6 [Stomoxys calcitrans]